MAEMARRGFALPVAFALLMLPASGAAQEEVHTCFGERATIVGTAGKDRLKGTQGRDVIRGRGGDDRIDGRGGDDLVCGEAGHDKLTGGSGDDVLDGDASTFGNDTLSGGGGDDRLFGELGDDIIVGGPGDDELQGGAGDDEDVDPGRDRLYGAAGNDVLDGGLGDDRLEGGRGTDELEGGSGSDRLLGGPGSDSLQDSFQGVDLLDGGRGNDKLDAGLGDDELYGGPGDDDLSGGSGDDQLFGGLGHDVLRGGDGNDLLDGGPGDDELDGELGNDSLRGGRGNDTLRGAFGNDRLAGGPGDDLLDGGPGEDILEGGPGTDQLVDPPEPPPATPLAALIDAGDRLGIRAWSADRSIPTINSAVAALDQTHRDRLAEVVLETNATGADREKMLRILRAVLANPDYGFYAEIWSYTFVELTGDGFFGGCNHLFLSPPAWAGLSDQDALGVLVHETFHSFNCVNGGPVGSLDEGSAIWVVKVGLGQSPRAGESWAEATYGSTLFHKVFFNNPNLPITAPLNPTQKLLDVYDFLAAKDPSQLPWNSTARLVTCFERYYADLDRNVDFFNVWLPTIEQRTQQMLADSECKPV